MTQQVRIDWYRTPIEKDKLRELTQRSDFKGFRHMILQLGFSLGTGALAYYSWLNWPWWATAAACYIHAMFYRFIGLSGPGHELSHRTVFRTRFWNELFMRISSFLGWNNFVHYRASHMQHHQYTVHRAYDMEVVLPKKITALDWFFLFTVDVPKLWNTFYVTVQHAFGRLVGEWDRRIFPESELKGRKALARWARVLLVGHALLAAVFLFTGQWILLFLVTFAPFYAEGLNRLCGETQHTGMKGDTPDYRLSTRSINLNPFLAFFYAQMQNHLEHHMYAGVPFYNLGKLHEELKHDLPKRKGLVGAWKDIFYALKMQKQDPNFTLAVDLPNPHSTPGPDSRDKAAS